MTLVALFVPADVQIGQRKQDRRNFAYPHRMDAFPHSPVLDLPIMMGAGRIRLWQVPCEEGLSSLLEPGSVDVVVTSPPYNIGIRYATHDDNLPREDYLAWMERVGTLVERVLSEDGSFFLNVGSRPADPWIAMDVAARLRGTFVLQNVIHWIKSVAIAKADAGRYPAITGDVAVGHYKPIRGTRFLHDCHEFIFHFTKTGAVELDRLGVGVPYQDKSNIGRWKTARADIRCRGNTWFIPYETIRDRKSQRPHPATFPVRLPEMCIRLHGLSRARLVVDPFAGLGSTAMAALRLGVAAEGFDIDGEYLAEAARRLERERETLRTRQVDLFPPAEVDGAAATPQRTLGNRARRKPQREAE